jgi:hypothetical protein
VAQRNAAPTLLATVGVVVVAAGFLAGSGQLADNSFLTHLATGRAFWDGDGFPRTDPYTFTAAGESWVVQSWLASFVYGAVERVAGLEGLRLLTATTTAALAGLAWHLSTPARSVSARLVLVLPVLVIAFDSWSERPFLFGLVGLSLVQLSLASRFDPRWLVPVMWLWVNAHGSWPLGFVLIGLVLLGRGLDRQSLVPQWAVLRWTALGTALAAINPYGIDILTFPVQLLGRREALAGLREWQRAPLTDVSTLAVLVLAVGTVIACRRRWRWEAALPAAAFVLAGLLSARNLLPAAFVLVAAAAPGLDGLGTIDGEMRSGRLRLVWAVTAAAVALVATQAVVGDAFDDRPFPVAAEAFLRADGLDPRTHRIVARDFVGNWLEARYGPTGMVYIDDRVEVLPLPVVQGHRALLRGDADWESILDELEADAVLWQSDEELAALLADDDSWVITYDDGEWLVAVPADRR